MNKGDAIGLIEAAYRVELGTEEWLQGIAASAGDVLGTSRGGFAFLYDASSGDWVQPGATVVHRLPSEFARDFLNHPNVPREAAAALARALLSVRFGSTRALFEKVGGWEFIEPVFARYGIEDLVGINGFDPSGRGCLVTVAVSKTPESTRTAGMWHRLAAHISAGSRLRAALEQVVSGSGDPTSRAEAVLSPNGKVEHATSAAQPGSARASLRAAMVRIDSARSERTNAERSVELWRGLVAGRWSLIEHFERDGRRYYLAHKNDPELAQDRKLTERERQVLAYAELGHSNKLIAYSLGLSSSTVATLLARARKKLPVTT